MIEIRRLAAEQKEEKEKAAKQKKAMQDKGIERLAQFEMGSLIAWLLTMAQAMRMMLVGPINLDRM